MKKAEIPKLKEEILKMLPKPQAEIWKELKIDTRECSKIILIMVDEKLVGRKKVKGKIIVEKYDNTKHCNINTPKFQQDENTSKLVAKLSKILPALQSDIWKKLSIERRYCSKLMKTMEENGLIKRTKVKGGTFMVERINIVNTNTIRKDFSALLSDSEKFSPCAGCSVDCNPSSCRLLGEWIADIRVK